MGIELLWIGITIILLFIIVGIWRYIFKIDDKAIILMFLITFIAITEMHFNRIEKKIDTQNFIQAMEWKK